MSQWPFVIAAYAAALLGVAGLVLWATAAMRRAEAKLDDLKRP